MICAEIIYCVNQRPPFGLAFSRFTWRLLVLICFCPTSCGRCLEECPKKQTAAVPSSHHCEPFFTAIVQGLTACDLTSRKEALRHLFKTSFKGREFGVVLLHDLNGLSGEPTLRVLFVPRRGRQGNVPQHVPTFPIWLFTFANQREAPS